MKKVQIFALEFGYGGVEREMVTLANSLINIFNIELIFMRKKFDTIPYKLNNKIKLTFIEDNIKIDFFIKSLNEHNINKYIKSIINSDTVISTNIYFNKFIDSVDVSNKIFWEHNHHNNTFELLSSVVNSTINFDTIVVPTKTLENYYKKSSNINVKMIPNVIDLNGDKLSKLDNKVLVSVGKIKMEKGFAKLIDVMEIINKMDKDIKLHIIGDGEYREVLEELVKSKHLTRVVSFFGVLEKHEVIEEYLNSSLFVMCSEHESFCISLMEAMTVGVPAVAFYDESLDGIITDDINGYLIYDNDINEMANKIVEVLNDKKHLSNLGSCAKEFVMFYDVNTLKSEWIKII